jgi:hypothetical protein
LKRLWDEPWEWAWFSDPAISTVSANVRGITPGFDKELIAPGEVTRVYVAVYAKVLVPHELLKPKAENLTPAVKALFDLLYPEQCLE